MENQEILCLKVRLFVRNSSTHPLVESVNLQYSANGLEQLDILIAIHLLLRCGASNLTARF